MAQVVEGLSSNPSTKKQKQKQKTQNHMDRALSTRRGKRLWYRNIYESRMAENFTGQKA
jgi:hypothetical protein